MSNTDRLYTILKGFQDSRKEVTDTFDKRMKEIESTKGSEYYRSESHKAEQKQRNDLEQLCSKYGKQIDSVLADMRDKNANRPMIPPTDEQLRILNILKLKDKISNAELDAAAVSCADCPVALSVVNELAFKNGRLQSYKGTSNEISIDDGKQAIDSLLKDIRSFLQYDTESASRHYADYMDRHYSVKIDANKRKLFDNKEDCYSEVAGLSGDSLKAFENAVDGVDQ